VVAQRAPGTLQASASGRIGAVFAHCRAQRGAPGTFHGVGSGFACTFPFPVIRSAGTGFALHLGHLYGGFPDVRFRSSPPWCLFTRGVEMEVPDLGHIPSGSLIVISWLVGGPCGDTL
jgi:hypothetical protein